MSEFEKQQRDEYQRKRKKWINVQAIIAAVLALATLIIGVCFFKINSAAYVRYTQDGNVTYKAYLKDNDFYDEEYLNGSHAYVATLIDKMTADFKYNLAIDTADSVNVQCSYRVDAVVEIKDNDTGAMIIDDREELLPTQTKTGNSIQELVQIDYQKYDKIARDFVDIYDVERATKELAVRMYINVVGESERFVEVGTDEYVIELYLPLACTVVNPTTKATIPTSDQKIQVIANGTKLGVMIPFIILAALEVIALGFLAFYVVLTRDKHIDYARKVQRTLSSYKSYIQKIINPFDTEGYQVLYLSRFTEMLEIRDTLQMPILMYENEDRTCASFFIATNTKVLYLFEIKVEDDEEEIEIVEEPEIEEPVEEVEEPIAEEIAEEIEEPVAEDSRIEVIDVVWPEHEGKENERLYRYDPDGEQLSHGDIVLVPSVDVNASKNITRNAKVKNGNYKMDPSGLKHPLKKIISVVKRK